MEGIIALLIPLAFVCIPIVAIVARHKEKVRRMELEAGVTGRGAEGGSAAKGAGSGSAGSADRTKALEERLAALEDTVADMSSEMDKMSRHLEFNEKLMEGKLSGETRQGPAEPMAGKKRKLEIEKEMGMEA